MVLYCRLAQNSPQSRGVRDLFSPGRSLELDKKAGLNKVGGKHKSMKDPVMIKEVTMIWWRVEAQAGLIRRWKSGVMTEVHENQKLCQWAGPVRTASPQLHLRVRDDMKRRKTKKGGKNRLPRP